MSSCLFILQEFYLLKSSALIVFVSFQITMTAFSSILIVEHPISYSFLIALARTSRIISYNGGYTLNFDFCHEVDGKVSFYS